MTIITLLIHSWLVPSAIDANGLWGVELYILCKSKWITTKNANSCLWNWTKKFLMHEWIERTPPLKTFVGEHFYFKIRSPRWSHVETTGSIYIKFLYLAISSEPCFFRVFVPLENIIICCVFFVVVVFCHSPFITVINGMLCKK